MDQLALFDLGAEVGPGVKTLERDGDPTSRTAGGAAGVPERLSEALGRYLETLVVTQGARAGEPFEVLPWEREFLELLDEPGDLALSVARKNGKTTLLSGVLAAAVDGPLAQPRADVVLVAASFRQALIAFRATKAFLFPSGHVDRRRFRVLDSTNVAEITAIGTGARLAVYGSNPDTLSGLQPSLILMDEPASWKRNTRDRVLAILRTAAGAIPDARMVAIGTRPADGSHWFERMLQGPRAITWAAEPEADVLDEDAWRAANPSLDAPGFEPLRETIEKEAREAKGDDLAEASFRALRLNAGVSEVSDGRLLVEAAEWKGCEVERPPARGGPLVIGFDLSGGSATCAAAAYWPESGRVEGFMLVPEVPDLARRGAKDGVGSLYQVLQQRGELVVAGRRVPDFSILVEEAVERWGRPAAITADPYKRRDLAQALEGEGLGRVRKIWRSGGYKHGAEDIRFFRRAVLRRRLRAPKSLAFRSALAEARTMPDQQGRLKLATRTQGDRRDRARDDLAAALLIAVAVGERYRERRPRKMAAAGGRVRIEIAG